MTNANKGLDQEEARARLSQLGYNELTSAKPKTIWKIISEVIKEPMFLLLIACSTLYVFLGDYKEGLILLSTILIIIVITFYQSQKTERAIEALKNLSSPRALVLRGGIELRIPGREVVVDDIILLNEGDRVPADGLVLEANNLTVDESHLTGESFPVDKIATTTRNENDCKVFSGSLVAQGFGKILVSATGDRAELGKIGMSIKNIKEDETRLQAEMKILIRRLFFFSILVCCTIIVLFYISHVSFIQSLLRGLTAMMALLPEEFPVVLTIFLAMGAWRLSRQKVLTRKPSAIETLGSATVLCSDKTGTITQNKMEVAAVYNRSRQFGKESFSREKKELTEMLFQAYQASRENTSDPMELAIDRAYSELNTSLRQPRLIKEYPFTKDLMMMARVLRNNDNDSMTVYAKGAPESILSLCSLPINEKEMHLKVVHQMATEGLRIIAVASATTPNEDLPDTPDKYNYTFSGLIGLADPIRPEVPSAIEECQQAGIRVIMITGDFPETATSIGKQIGLKNYGQVMTGQELDMLSDEELKTRIGNISTFARAIPDQKLRIVNALKSNNEIVAMTGDGVNDAPALKAAHIGVAMGNKGTDVAREASSLVLLDDNFASIVSAIRSGRRIYDNLKKAMSYIVAIHVTIVGLTLLPAFFSTLPILLLPLHIVFLELIIDPVCSIAFETEREEMRIMQRPPRPVGKPFFGRRKMIYSILSGLLLLVMVVGVYLESMEEGHTIGEVRAIAFSALIIGNIFLIITNLSTTRFFFSTLAERNVVIASILTLALAMLIIIISVPWMQEIFSFQFPGYRHFVSSIIGATLLLVILETRKYFVQKKLNIRR